jgi:predicted nuclease of predicted toxin-antitoxin system
LRILLDECLPKRLAQSLSAHEVKTVPQMNWAGLSNGKLLAAAANEFEVFITVDKNLVHQNTLSNFRIAVIVLRVPSNKIEDIIPLLPNIIEVLMEPKPGQAVTIGA